MTAPIFSLDRQTRLCPPNDLTPPVSNAIAIFARDFEKVVGATLETSTAETSQIVVRRDTEGTLDAPESFTLRFSEEGRVLTLIGRDDLGVVYGLLHLSHVLLGVDPLWYWADKEPEPRTACTMTAEDYVSPARCVRYRGWFVNDEVCLIGWTDVYPPPREVWMRVFEALLRLGGNLVIPGTDLPRNGVQADVATEMGLYLTHHHAEPLGSEMFFRAYPDSDASFDKNPELFAGLWREGIERQRQHNMVWTLGFRGQGDRPFWDHDPSYDTDERRGELISRAIRYQYDMLRAEIPDAACLTYLYGEIAELYRGGHISLPDDVTRIWSDNGYGRMVTRRQGNHNLRLPALPAPGASGLHGIYYHAAFHDLQASSHLAMLPVPAQLIVEEIAGCFAAGAGELWLINCGNVRPHIYTLDLLARLWNQGQANDETATLDFATRYFPDAAAQSAACLNELIAAAASYGPNADDRAGDEFYHHPTRLLIGHAIRGEVQSCAERLIWATGEVSFENQVGWFGAVATAAERRYRQLEHHCRKVRALLPPKQARLFDDFLLFQTRLMQTGAEGLSLVCRSIEAQLRQDFPRAFVLASQAQWSFERSLVTLGDSEQGKWENFFRADWLTNVKMTIYSCQSLRMFYRMHGDNPDFFLWHKEFLMPESEKKIYLENTHRNPPSDDDLARRLQQHFGL